MNPFSRDSIERLSTAQKEPSWMTVMRLDAWKAYERFSANRPGLSLEGIRPAHPSALAVDAVLVAASGIATLVRFSVLRAATRRSLNGLPRSSV